MFLWPPVQDKHAEDVVDTKRVELPQFEVDSLLSNSIICCLPATAERTVAVASSVVHVQRREKMLFILALHFFPTHSILAASRIELIELFVVGSVTLRRTRLPSRATSAANSAFRIVG